MMNAFETTAAASISTRACRTQAFPFIRGHRDQRAASSESGGGLTRWTFDLEQRQRRVEETVIGPPGDLPRIPDERQGRPYNHVWMLTMNPEMQGPPIAGGPVGATFNLLLRIDFAGEPPQALALPPGHCINEPVHVPAGEARA